MKSARAASLAILFAILLVGATPVVAAQEEVSMDVRMRDSLRFDPNRIVVPPGASVTLRLINEGVIDHTFTLFAQKDAQVPVNNEVQLQAYNASNSKIVDARVGPGAQTTVTFTAPVETGTYTFVCMVPLHSVGDMHGVLIVGTNQGLDSTTIAIIVGVVVVVAAAAVFFFLRRGRE